MSWNLDIFLFFIPAYIVPKSDFSRVGVCWNCEEAGAEWLETTASRNDGTTWRQSCHRMEKVYMGLHLSPFPNKSIYTLVHELLARRGFEISSICMDVTRELIHFTSLLYYKESWELFPIVQSMKSKRDLWYRTNWMHGESWNQLRRWMLPQVTTLRSLVKADQTIISAGAQLTYWLGYRHKWEHLKLRL